MIKEEHLKFIAEVSIPNYPREIMTAKARRPTYYKKGTKLSKTIESKIGIEYEWRDALVTVKGKPTLIQQLFDIDKNEKVIKNSKSAGKPRMLRINGQKLHMLTLQPYERSKILHKLKGIFAAAVSNLPSIKDKPLIIMGELRDTYYDMLNLDLAGNIRKNASTDWDVDNRLLFYNKTFLDVLTGCKQKNPYTKKIEPTMRVIIEDDHRGIVTMPPSLIFTPIEEGHTPSLIYRIYADLRPVITHSKHY
jgi:hypothetical protein